MLHLASDNYLVIMQREGQNFTALEGGQGERVILRMEEGVACLSCLRFGDTSEARSRLNRRRPPFRLLFQALDANIGELKAYAVFESFAVSECARGGSNDVSVPAGGFFHLEDLPVDMG